MTTLQPSALSALAAGVLVVALLSAALEWVAARRAVRRADAQSDDACGTVVCPACDTENDPAYRYCQTCVAELPSPPVDGRVDLSASRRLIR